MAEEQAKENVSVQAAQEKAPAKPAEAAKPVEPVAQQQTNCPACNKPIRKLKRYYRDGKFYCNKKCWKKAITPKAEAK